MAIISTFELLVKRIAPLTGNPNIDALFRRVVQGYFLTITNPTDRTVTFRLRARCSRLTGRGTDTAVERELVLGNPNVRNHIYTYDITGGPNNGQDVYEPLRCRSVGEHSVSMITRNLTIEPLQTAAFKLLPDTTSAAINLADPQLEIRGYLEIVQVPRSSSPVDLIFTPEIRGSFLDNDFPMGGPYDFDQIAYSIPTTTGAAQMTVDETEFPFILCFDFDFKLPPIEFDPFEKLPVARDFQGNQYLDDKGIKALQDEVNKWQKKYPEATFNFKAIKSEVESILNTPSLNIEKKKK
ncbi:MAG: hypothetical protein RIG62_14965 [Cyclobacteriaceae bacterium]